MFKKVLSALALTCVVAAASAQDAKFFVLNTEGVNFREKPSSTSQRLMANGDEYGYSSFSFGRGDGPARLDIGYPYLSPVQQQEWSQIICEDPNGDLIPVWVMNKFLTEVKPVKLESAAQLAELAKNQNIEDWLRVRTASPNAGLVLIVNDAYDDTTVSFPYVNSNKGCLTIKITTSFFDNTDDHVMTLGDEPSFQLSYAPSQLKTITKEDYQFPIFDVNTLTEQQYKTLEKNLIKFPEESGRHLYYFAPQADISSPEGVWRWITEMN